MVTVVAIVALGAALAGGLLWLARLLRAELTALRAASSAELESGAEASGRVDPATVRN